jgi:DNA invertase Pin-like site-specific DNA recombinase
MSGQTVGYARVSTRDQNPQLQMDALEQAGCDRVFVEKASGALRERPQLAAALEYIRPGDVLVVWKLDRLGRSLRHLIDTVTALEERGVGFRSLKESIDTTTATGRLIFHIFAALAQFEREMIRERADAGRAAARARGETGGRPSIMTPRKLAAAQLLIAGGASVRQAAETIGVGKSTLQDHLAAGRKPSPTTDDLVEPSGQRSRTAPAENPASGVRQSEM